jgi:predicted NACHT family NTPase
MPIDPLTIVGVANVVGLVFKPILEDFAKDVLKDTAKDYVKGCFGSVFSSLRKEPLQRALGKALRELLQLIQDELLDCGLTEEELEDWIPQVKEFTRSDGLQQALRQLFTESDSRVDPSLLARSWEAVAARSLPEGFSWQRIAGRFTRAVRSLREQDAELRDILNTQAAVETARAVKQQAGLAPDFDLDSYRDALLERYANLHFQTLDTTGAYYSNVKLWSVFVPQSVRETQEYYPQLLEVPKEHLRRMRERGEIDAEDAIEEELVEERRRSYIDQSPRPVLEVCDDDRIGQLVVLGDPGSGKSSLLQFLALRWARIEDPTLLYTQPLPLLVELREYDRWQCASGKSFVRFLHEGQTWHRLNQSDLDRKLRVHGATVLLLDGLDEIFDAARREDVLNNIQLFSNDYPETKVIVTSRVFGYKQQRLSDAEFRHFMLQDLDDEQVAEFLDRWHETTFDRSGDRDFKKERLAKALRESPAIRELGGNPLLLTMMSILNRSQELPRDRVRLYEQASRVLLHEWDTERALGSDPQLKDAIGYPEKAAILREVADYMQHAPEGLAGNIIAREQLERILRDYLKDKLGFSEPHGLARKLVDQLRERNFILCYLGGDSYAFVHRTFLEYFCASAIVVRFRQKLSMDFLKDEVFGAHWREETWHEVLCLIAGMIAESSVEQVGEIIEFLLSQHDDAEYEFHHVFLAARCYQEIRIPSSLTLLRQRLVSEIEKLLKFDFPFYYEDRREPDFQQRRSRVRIRALISASLFLPDPRPWFRRNATEDNDPDVRQAAVQALARGWKDDPHTLPLLKDRAAYDANVWVRQAAVLELVRGWKDDPDTLLWLKDRAANDDNDNVRQAAVYELARGWKDDSDTLPWLKDRAANDDNEWVRQAAVQALARGWKDDPDTLPLLKDRAANDDNEYVRQAAVHELVRGWKDNRDTLPWLKDRTANDDNDNVRQAALHELARRWKDDPDTLALLKDRATNDSDWFVRQAAVQELARGWKDDPDTLPLLKDRVPNDEFYPVRQAAVYELARGWKDDSDTLPLLKDCAANEDYWDVRQAAVQELARGWKDHPDTLPLLRDRAAKDHNEYVRQAAVHELARGWKDHPDTLPLLKEGTANDDNGSVRRAAAQELARGWNDDPDTLPLLKDRAANDDDDSVRRVAVHELARGWKDHPDTLPLLKDRVANDVDVLVKRVAMQALARGWKDDAATLPWLKGRAANDDDDSVRGVAVHELARGWRDDADTLPLLKDRAANDRHRNVRREALLELARGWKDHPDTLRLLKDRAANDDDESVRQTAGRELARGWLARGWKDDADVLEFLATLPGRE